MSYTTSDVVPTDERKSLLFRFADADACVSIEAVFKLLPEAGRPDGAIAEAIALEDELATLAADLATAIATISALTVERNNSERREYEAQGTINRLRSALVDVEARIDMLTSTPGLDHMRVAVRAAILNTKAEG